MNRFRRLWAILLLSLDFSTVALWAVTGTSTAFFAMTFAPKKARADMLGFCANCNSFGEIGRVACVSFPTTSGPNYTYYGNPCSRTYCLSFSYSKIAVCQQ